MPQFDRARISPYPFTIAANGTINGLAPDNSNRNYLLIQNQGANPLEVMFGKTAEANPTIVIGGGQTFIWDDVVPTESINLRSVGGTTGVVYEGNPL